MDINQVLVILGIILVFAVLYRMGVLRDMFMWIFKLATGSVVGLIFVLVIGVLAFIVVHPYLSGGAGWGIANIFGG